MSSHRFPGASQASAIPVSFLLDTLPALDTSLESTTVSEWVKAPTESGMPKVENIRMPIRGAGPDREYAADQLCSNRGSFRRVSVVFSALLLGAVTFNFPFMSSPHRLVMFKDLDSFKRLADEFGPDFMVNTRPYRKQNIRTRDMSVAAKVWDVAKGWEDATRIMMTRADDGTFRLPFEKGYDFILGRHIPGVSEFTSFVIACDLVHFGLVHVPSARELWRCMAKGYKSMASKRMLYDLKVIRKAKVRILQSEENSSTFEALFNEV
jgi:hypothetical protein